MREIHTFKSSNWMTKQWKLFPINDEETKTCSPRHLLNLMLQALKGAKHLM